MYKLADSGRNVSPSPCFIFALSQFSYGLGFKLFSFWRLAFCLFSLRHLPNKSAVDSGPNCLMCYCCSIGRVFLAAPCTFWWHYQNTKQRHNDKSQDRSNRSVTLNTWKFIICHLTVIAKLSPEITRQNYKSKRLKTQISM